MKSVPCRYCATLLDGNGKPVRDVGPLPVSDAELCFACGSVVVRGGRFHDRQAPQLLRCNQPGPLQQSVGLGFPAPEPDVQLHGVYRTSTAE